MLNPTVAINYAKVIMNNKSIDIDKLYACFYNVSVFLSEHPLLDYALKNQFITEENKKELFTNTIDIDLQFKPIFNFIFDNKRSNYLPLIVCSFLKLYREKNKIGEVTIISCSEPTENIKNKIVEIIKKDFNLKEVIYNVRIDKNIINGYKILINNELLDMSIEGILKKIENDILK